MTDLTHEEQFILNAISEHGDKNGELGYKQLQDLCGDEFEGVRLILKKMKSKGLVTFDGMIPDYSAIIKKL